MHTQPSPLRAIFMLATPHRGKLLASTLLVVIGECLGIVPFLLAAFLIRHLADAGGMDTLYPLLYPLTALGAAAVILKQIALALSSRLAHVSAYAILHSLRISIIDKLRELPLGVFDRNTTGRIKKVFLEDVEQLENFLGHNLPEFIGAIVYLTVVGVALCVADWPTALAILLPLPVAFYAQTFTIKKNSPIIGKFYAANEAMNTTMIQYVQGMPVIKAFNSTHGFLDTFIRDVTDCSRLETEFVKNWYLPMTLYTAILSTSLLFLLPVGGLRLLHGDIDFPRFSLCLFLGFGFASPLFKLTSLGRRMAKNLASHERIRRFLATPGLPEPHSPAGVEGHGIRFSGVSFSYDRDNVLTDLTLDIPAGQTLAIVGASGAGKTTLARLIPRFWDVGGGVLQLGKRDVRDLGTPAVMGQVSFIFQDLFFFDDTILENLRFANPRADTATVEAAARAARCHEFITALPDGYHTMVGERGMRLSGGEKQRLAIARALLKPAPVVVIDEATAFVDPENEAEIIRALNRLMAEKTVVIIAHRLSTIIGADRIIVLDKGRIIGEGRHDRLISDCPQYQRLWEAHTRIADWKLVDSGRTL